MARRYCYACWRQATADTSIEQVHTRFLTAFCEVPPPWGRAGFDDCRFEMPPIGGNILSQKSLTKLLGRGVSGSIYYNFRHPEMRETETDGLSIYFDAERADLKSFIYDAFPIYNREIEPYRASLWDEEIAIRERFMTDPATGSTRQVEIDARKEVDRIYQCEYWCKDLCRNAFGLTPSQVSNHVKEVVEHVEATEIGVWLVYRSTLMSEDEVLMIDGIIRPLLTKKRAFGIF